MQQSKFLNAVLIAINVMLIFLTFRGFYHMYAVLSFPYDIANGEGFVLRDAAVLRGDSSIYQAVDRSPFLVSNYPPLFPWIASKVMFFTGPSFIATRSVSALAFMGIAGLIFYFLRKNNISAQYSLFGASMFFNSMYVYYWSAWSRVDGLAVFFGLWAIVAIGLKIRIGSTILAALCCFAAVATKQSAYLLNKAG